MNMRGATPVILVVDDSLTVRMDLHDAFRSTGFDVLPCATLQDARQVLGNREVDLFILDVILPDGNGIDFLRELRADARIEFTPVLILSSETEVRDRKRGLETGATEYVGKPYDARYVVARACELLSVGSAGVDEPGSLLFIDDSLTYRGEMQEAFEGAGYRVLTASSGEEGLRIATTQAIAAIVVDGVLPGIDGATLIRKLRLDAALRNTPCILLTGSENYETELQALDAGADAYIRKSEPADVILARVQAVLRNIVAGGTSKTASLLAPKKVLAVDDSPTFLNEIAEVLRGEGYDVVPARSGEEALELLAVQPVDCILLDLMMPGIGGQETCRRIKASPLMRDVPLIILTSVEDRDSMIHGLTLGADDFIRKSSDFEVLKARVRAQLRRKQFESEHRLVREELLRRELTAAEARAARELAEARATMVEELERKNRELEAFSYSVSHDLQAPLRSIDGYSQLLMENCAERLEDEEKHYLQQMRSAAHRMSGLIDDLLELAQAGSAELKREVVDLSAMAGEILEQLRAAGAGHEVACSIAPNLRIDADARLIRIVLDNILGNAWKYTSRAKHASIAVGCEMRRNRIAFFVRDNGAGFDMGYAENLFRPFQRLHLASEFPGSGIGLATVKRIVDRHGGEIWAESEIGQGSSFYFHMGRSERGE
jgi:two-component system, NtrC family, sensor kinase